MNRFKLSSSINIFIFFLLKYVLLPDIPMKQLVTMNGKLKKIERLIVV